MASGINWIKCSEELPKKSGKYLTIAYPGQIEHLDYSAKHQKWNVTDNERYLMYEIKGIQWWAEPNFPEGFEGVM